jgi:alanine-alpha-ketoisovalerate/valine-pyruvate aminotransferase
MEPQFCELVHKQTRYLEESTRLFAGEYRGYLLDEYAHKHDIMIVCKPNIWYLSIFSMNYHYDYDRIHISF